MAELAVVAAMSGDDASASAIRTAMAPHRHQLVVSGGANSAMGPASRYLGLLALQLGDLDGAIEDLEAATELETAIGALPGLANSLSVLALAHERRGNEMDIRRAADDRSRASDIAASLELGPLLADRLSGSGTDWLMVRDGDDWILEAAGRSARLRHSRGLDHLHLLLANPRREIAALDLAAGGTGLTAPRLIRSSMRPRSPPTGGDSRSSTRSSTPRTEPATRRALNRPSRSGANSSHRCAKPPGSAVERAGNRQRRSERGST